MSVDIKNKILKLREEINKHDYLYNVLDKPALTDEDYDNIYRELEDLEKEYPEYMDENSPTQRIGAKPLNGFEKVEHTVQMQSLQDVFSEEELKDFLIRLESNVGDEIDYVVERKIDGLSVSLEYVDGKFYRGSTRGDGFTGEDITVNLRTIKSIPMTLKENIELLEVRGEVFISKLDFAKLNEEQIENEEQEFANPRNASAGSVRQLDPQIAAKRKLDIFIFNIQSITGKSIVTHFDILEYLEYQGFKVNKGYELCKNIGDVLEKVKKIGEEKNNLPYEIDGAVIKVNNIGKRNLLGQTAKTPKWAVAYKYPAEKKETIIRNIFVNVGRTGVLTPNAEFDTIRLAGTNVSKATLHNMDYINSRNIKIGSRVLVQKAGDIIPEVISVIAGSESNDDIIFEMPQLCPVCQSTVIRGNESAFRCTGLNCPAKLQRSIIHFVSRDAMDIDGLGPSIVEVLLNNKFIKGIADLYTLYEKREELIKLDRMGEKSVNNLLKAIENSKNRALERLIYGLGIKHIGLGAAKIIVKYYNDIDSLINAKTEDISQIPEFGDKMAEAFIGFFGVNDNINTINLLKEANVIMVNKETKKIRTELRGQSFVLTGTLEKYSRADAKELIESLGGKVIGSVSKNTTFVLKGDNPGNKYEKALSLGVQVINESEFENLIKNT